MEEDPSPKLFKKLEKLKQELSQQKDDIETITHKLTIITNQLSDIIHPFNLSQNNTSMDQYQNGSVITLNVGGVIYQTTKYTLTGTYPESMLAAMFSGRHPMLRDKDGNYFVDANGVFFEYVLNFLRYGKTFLPVDDVLKDAVYNQMAYFGLNTNLLDNFSDSTVLNNLQKSFLLSNVSNHGCWKLIYKASYHGFRSSVFHEKCDDLEETISIIHAETGCVFGGYTKLNWSGSGVHKKDEDTFLFSLISPSSETPVILPVSDNKISIYCANNYMMTFGNPHNLRIYDNCNTERRSYCSLGGSFRANDRVQTSEDLAGAENFIVTEIEVFSRYPKNSTNP